MVIDVYVCVRTYTPAHILTYIRVMYPLYNVNAYMWVFSQVWDICLHSRQPNVLSMTILRNLGYSITHATK